MTRETKVGAVVAVSFLSLVGVVVVSKWRGGADEEAVALAVKPAEPQPVESTPPEKKRRGDSAPAAAANAIEHTKFEVPGDLVPLPNKLPGAVEESNTPPLPPQPAPLPPLHGDDDALKKLQEQIAADNQKKNALPSLPPLPPLAPNVNDAVPNVAGQLEQMKNNAGASLDKNAKQVQQGLGGLLNSATNSMNNAAAKVDDKVKTQIGQGLNAIDANLNRAADAANNSAAKANQQVNDGLRIGNDKVGQALVAANNQLEDLTKKGTEAVNKGLDRANTALPPVPPPPTPASANGLPPVVDAAPKLPALPMPGLPAAPLPPVGGGTEKPLPPGTPEPTLNGLAPPPPPTPVANVPPPPVPLSNASKVEPPRPPLPLPEPKQPSALLPMNNAPPIPAPPQIEAKVANYDVKSYVMKGGETLPGLSKAEYGSEKYANALLAYNRDFAGNAGLAANLQVGQKLLVPPVQVLQERYATAIAETKAISINAPVPAAPVIPMPQPMGAMDASGRYRVPAQGQLLYEIAIRTLGDGNRWTEIYRLNPNIDPRQPIPGGTDLRMPGNARVQ